MLRHGHHALLRDIRFRYPGYSEEDFATAGPTQGNFPILGWTHFHLFESQILEYIDNFLLLNNQFPSRYVPRVPPAVEPANFVVGGQARVVWLRHIDNRYPLHFVNN
jgi:hypothetical protein